MIWICAGNNDDNSGISVFAGQGSHGVKTFTVSPPTHLFIVTCTEICLQGSKLWVVQNKVESCWEVSNRYCRSQVRP